MSIEPEQQLDKDAEDALQQFLSAALELKAEGIEPQLAEICESRPELQDMVATALEFSNKMPQLQSRVRDHDPLIGRALANRYRLDKAIGAGAMGVVYSGIDLELKRPIAVKLLRPDLFGGAEAEGRFEREAESMAALSHPAVVTVYDRGTTDGDLSYLVMELLEGTPLSDVLQSAADIAAHAGGPDRVEQTECIRPSIGSEAELEPSWLRQAVRWVAELAAGVEAAHDAGIYHRDIKPSNVFIRKNGRPVLIDFGIVARDDHATLSSRDNALGTPAYMAPEQLDERPEPSSALDVYGLSATLYHLITLRAPYDGSPSEVIARLMQHEPTPAFRHRANLPRDLQAILDCGMARRPKGRYASARDLAADLHAFLAHRPVAARPISSISRLWRGLRRSREFITSVVVVSTIALAYGGYALNQSLTQRRSAHWFSIWRTIPPSLNLSRDLDSLVIQDLDQRAEIQTLLDDLVAYADHPVPSAVLRAAFRLDHGDVAGAVADMEDVRSACDSEFVDALVERYRALDRDARGAATLDTEGLPDPGTDDDLYLSAFHHLRRGISQENVAAALPLLVGPAVESNLAAQELSFISSLYVAKNEPDKSKQAELFRQGLDLLGLFEGAHGRTATTAQLRVAALMGLKRFTEAGRILEQGLELAPRSDNLLLNLGLLNVWLGDYRRAEEVLKELIRLRPRNLHAWTNLVQSQLQDGEFEAAQSTIDRAPYPAGKSGKISRLKLQTRIHCDRALSAKNDNDYATAVSQAQSVLRLNSELEQLGSSAPPLYLRIADAIVVRDDKTLYSSIGSQLRKDPLSPFRLHNYISVLPPRLDDQEVAILRDILVRLLSRLNNRSDNENSPRK